MKTIKIEDIAIKFGIVMGCSIHSNTVMMHKSFNEYSLELIRQVLELASENARAKIEVEYDGNTGSEYYENYAVVDKQSILNTINQLEV